MKLLRKTRALRELQKLVTMMATCCLAHGFAMFWGLKASGHVMDTRSPPGELPNNPMVSPWKSLQACRKTPEIDHAYTMLHHVTQLLRVSLKSHRNWQPLHIHWCFSPHVRWGLSDFMSAYSSSASSASSSSSSSFSSSYCDDVCAVFCAGPQPRSCEASVACRTSTSAIMWGQCCVPDLNRDHVSSMWRTGPQLRNVSERRTSERMSEDMSERMSKDMSERMSEDMSEDISERMSKDMSERMSKDMSERVSEDMSERMSKDMSERVSEDMSERMSKDMSERMSEDCFQSVCEVESNRRHFRRWVVCLPSPDPLRLT